MSPRVDKETTNILLHAPRIPKIFSRSQLFDQALTKRDFLFDQSFFIDNLIRNVSALTKVMFTFDQSFFITGPDRIVRLFRILVCKAKAFHFGIGSPFYDICFLTSVF